jgi:hypothetical protein
MASNRITEKSWLPVSLVIVIVCMACGATASFWHLTANLASHCSNPEAHHTTQYLQQTYVTRAEYGVMLKQLDRIETKTDSLIQMHIEKQR